MRPSFSLRLLLPAVLSVSLAVLPAVGAFAAARSDADQPAATTQRNDSDGSQSSAGGADEGDNAHPSGRDRSVEPGGSGGQGNAQSDPDDDGRGPDRSNGGDDQPGGGGGVDKRDQDRNNGCGNDDDFEDDNEGLCRGPVKKTSPDDTDDADNNASPDDTDDADNNGSADDTDDTGDGAVDDDAEVEGKPDTDRDVTVAPRVDLDDVGSDRAPVGERNVAPITTLGPPRDTATQQPSATGQTTAAAAGETPAAPPTALAAPDVAPSAAPESSAVLAATGGTSVRLLGLAAIALLLGTALLRSARKPAVSRAARDQA